MNLLISIDQLRISTVVAVICFAYSACTPASSQIIQTFTEPIRLSQVAAAESGIIRQIDVREGQRVMAGDSLAVLDKSILEKSLQLAMSKAKSNAQVNAAQAELEIKEQQFEKLKKLDEDGHANPYELKRAFAEYRAAISQFDLAIEERGRNEIEVERIQAQLARRTVRCPFDGVVTDVHKEVGEFVASNEPEVVTIVQLTQLRARFYLNVDQAARLQKGDSVPVSIGWREDPVIAIVELVSPIIDPDSKTVRIDVLVDNSGSQFKSGIECRLVLDAPSVAKGQR